MCIRDSKEVINISPVKGQYEREIDRESAYEILQGRAEEVTASAQKAEKEEALERPKAKRRSTRQGYIEATTKSVLRSVGSSVGRQIAKALLRGVLGSFLK